VDEHHGFLPRRAASKPSDYDPGSPLITRGTPMAEPFTQTELKELQDRANDLATNDSESDASLRTALQLFAEAAANLIPKLPHED